MSRHFPLRVRTGKKPPGPPPSPDEAGIFASVPPYHNVPVPSRPGNCLHSSPPRQRHLSWIFPPWQEHKIPCPIRYLRNPARPSSPKIPVLPFYGSAPQGTFVFHLFL